MRIIHATRRGYTSYELRHAASPSLLHVTISRRRLAASRCRCHFTRLCRDFFLEEESAHILAPIYMVLALRR